MIHRSPGLGCALNAISPLEWKNAAVYAGFVLSWPAYPWLKEISDGAALLVPPLTLVFLLIRIYLAVKGKDK